MTNIPCPPPDLNPSDQYHFSIFTKYEMLRKDGLLLQWKKQVIRNEILSPGNFKLQVEDMKRGKQRSSYKTHNCDSDHILIEFISIFVLPKYYLLYILPQDIFVGGGFQS